MVSKNLKDLRRADLILPYTPATKKADEQNFAETIATALPMAAMFMRHKLLAWTALVFAILAWLNESPGQTAAGKQPAFLGVGMALMSIGVTYMPMFFPAPERMAATSTGPAPPVEPQVGA